MRRTPWLQANLYRARWDDRVVELNDLSGAARLVLHPVSYEFETAVGDDWDDNWLVIAGEVVSGGREWSFQEPSLVVDEAVEIANWLERVAARVEAPVMVDQTRDVKPSLAFTEPNLAFSVHSYGEDTAVIRIRLSLETLPPDRRGPAAQDIAGQPFWTEMQITLAAATSAAASWRIELASYPRR